MSLFKNVMIMYLIMFREITIHYVAGCLSGFTVAVCKIILTTFWCPHRVYWGYQPLDLESD